MDKFYIKEGDSWLGPLSEIEFEFRKSGMDSFEYWKPEFCENHILHPALCSHTKTWIKAQQKAKQKKETVSPPEEIREPENNDVIISAKPLDPDEEEVVEKLEPEPEAIPEREKIQKQEPQPGKSAGKSYEPGTLFKVIVIIIGFILVLGAGYYVNSKLSILFYQDIMIQESVREIEEHTRDMIDETKAIKSQIDSLDLKIEKQYEVLNEDLSTIKSQLSEIENQR